MRAEEVLLKLMEARFKAKVDVSKQKWIMVDNLEGVAAFALDHQVYNACLVYTYP